MKDCALENRLDRGGDLDSAERRGVDGVRGEESLQGDLIGEGTKMVVAVFCGEFDDEARMLIFVTGEDEEVEGM